MSSYGIFFLATALLFETQAKPARQIDQAADPTNGKFLQISANRPCARPTRRRYSAHNRGIGFEILDSESEACFVPDEEYKLLDRLIDSVLAKVKYDSRPKTAEAKHQQAAIISKTISDVLAEHQFGVFVDTETLSDALIERGDSNSTTRHIFDCDTGSLIFLTIAENLGAPVAMVEIPTSGNDDHLYVRWLSDGLSFFEWDMNDRMERSTPAGLPVPFGKSMTRDEVTAYALTLRPKLWERRGLYDDAVRDYQTALMLYGGATEYNNFAWLIATHIVSRRQDLQKAALFSAKKAISIMPRANYRDTLACVYALTGHFEQAIAEEDNAIRESPDEEFIARRARFRMLPARDCTGDG
jgi:tetratricopeptide (TPR) repeat protein